MRWERFITSSFAVSNGNRYSKIQLMLSNTFVAGRLNLIPSAVRKLVSRGRLEAETSKIADNDLPNVK
jgi:hypothetical protein